MRYSAKLRVLRQLVKRAEKEGRDRDAELHRSVLESFEKSAVVEPEASRPPMEVLEELEEHRGRLKASAEANRRLLGLEHDAEKIEDYQRELAYDEIFLEEVERQIEELKRGSST